MHGAGKKVEDRSAHEIFGNPDDLKFRSSVMLFASAYREALAKHFGGALDVLTVEVLRQP